MKYGYYPGCSLERNASAYHRSTIAVAKRLGVEFSEIDDWNCCGATEYIAVNRTAAYALVGRNLALAQQQFASKPTASTAVAMNGRGAQTNGGSNGSQTNGGNDGPAQVVAPCSACYLNLSKVDRYMGDSPALARTTNLALAAGGLSYTPGSVRVRHLLDVMVSDVGYDAIAAQVVRPLRGLRVAPYYGCLVVRPGFQGQFDDPEYPTSLDRLLRALGATVVDFPLKSHCCGGHMTQISQDVALELLRRLLKNAADYKADAIVTLCPMCQLNLDLFQDNVNRKFDSDFSLPVLFFTQLMGLAFGMSATELGIGSEIVDARPALSKIGAQQLAEPVAAARRSKGDRSLPMPRLPEEE